MHCSRKAVIALRKGNSKVFVLFDDNDRRQLRIHLKKELDRVEHEIQKNQRDQQMLADIDAALEEIQQRLGVMRELAELAASNPDIDKAVLAEKFEALKAEIDSIAETRCAKWSAAESAYLRKMVAALNSAEL